MESITENKMGTMPVGRLLTSMAVPMMISMLVQALYNVVDSVFVARINEGALAAVSMAFPIQTIMISVISGLCVGMNAMLSKSLGAGENDEVNLAANNGVFLGIVSYALFLLIGIFLVKPFYISQISYDLEIVGYGIDYLSIVCIFSFGMTFQFVFERMLQATGRTFLTMITQTSGALINIVLDPMFIFGIGFFPKMGVRGAAVATVIGQIFAGFLALVFNIKYNREITLKTYKIFHPNKRVLSIICRVGLPSIVMSSIGSFMYYGMNIIMTGFNSTASAVFGVYYKLQSFFFLPVFGMNNAVVPIMAYNWGATKRSRVTGTLKYALIMAFAIMVIGTALFELIPGALLKFFSASDYMLEIGIPALRITGICFPIAAICIVIGSAFQALSKASYSAINSVCRQFVVLLPVAFVLSRVGGLRDVWYSFFIAETVSLALSLFFFKRIYRNIIMRIPNNI